MTNFRGCNGDVQPNTRKLKKSPGDGREAPSCDSWDRTCFSRFFFPAEVSHPWALVCLKSTKGRPGACPRTDLPISSCVASMPKRHPSSSVVLNHESRTLGAPKDTLYVPCAPTKGARGGKRPLPGSPSIKVPLYVYSTYICIYTYHILLRRRR